MSAYLVGSGVLSGPTTVTAAYGVATFPGMSISMVGYGLAGNLRFNATTTSAWSANASEAFGQGPPRALELRPAEGRGVDLYRVPGTPTTPALAEVCPCH